MAKAAATGCDAVVARLRSMANPEAVRGMARFGINPKGTLGVSMPALRRLGKELGRGSAPPPRPLGTGSGCSLRPATRAGVTRLLANLPCKPAVGAGLGARRVAVNREGRQP